MHVVGTWGAQYTFYHLPLILTVLLNADLINVGNLTACVFIRSWWGCTFWMTSPMTLNPHKIDNYVVITSVKTKPMGKLIKNIRFPSFDIKSTRLGFKNACRIAGQTSWFNKYSQSKKDGKDQESIQSSTTPDHKALPGKLDIKRHSPSILYII